MKLDLLEVINLQRLYSFTRDTDCVEPAALFADNAVFSRPGGHDVVGRQSHEEFGRGTGKAGVHTGGAPLVLDRGSVLTPFAFVGSGSCRISRGCYHDAFTRSSGALPFKRRGVDFQATSPGTR